MFRLRTRASIRIKHSNTLLAGAVLEEALLRAIIGSAGQTGQVNQHGDLLGLGLWGQVEVEGHFAVCGGGIVAKLEELAAE